MIIKCTTFDFFIIAYIFVPPKASGCMQVAWSRHIQGVQKVAVQYGYIEI